MNVDSRPISSRTSEDPIPQFEIFQGARIHRLYGTKEPTVISEKLLKAAVYAQGPKEEAGRIARVEGIEYDTVKQLALHFQNILRISNLDEFTNLTKLQLDNNIIEKIENLEGLINLTCLDLSFNRIKKIENLSTLTKLEDLSLFHNQIEKIEGMDELHDLKFLSLGKNHIEDLENVLYLRQFHNLHSLTLEGNPLTHEPTYVTYVCAFLAQLQYLDYKRILGEMRASAYQKYQITVDQMNEAQREQEEYEEGLRLRKELDIQHANAFVDEVEGDSLYNAIIEADPDGQKFVTLPLVQEVIDQYPFRIMPSSF
ncbi:unnamed protein product [Calicophoron daubneyi]|uniref:Dynein regulatory complex subunit 3 n=1 Tax=Calicophoron daubneyi TaxID=300641 RepID=A0AAV2TNM5_CALDB